MSEASIRARVRSQVAQAAAASRAPASATSGGFDSYVENGYVIVGSPDEVAEQLRSVVLDLNIGQLMLLMQFGNMKRELVNYNTELFAKRVLPQLRGLFEDRWENHWWPRPLPTEERALPRDVSP